MVELPTCACGCGAKLERKGKTGPPPQYATKACRMRALRLRNQSIELVPLPDVIRDAPVSVGRHSVNDQIARAVLEARAVGFALQRLGSLARPDLSWRCTRVGQAIEQALSEAFGEMTE